MSKAYSEGLTRVKADLYRDLMQQDNQEMEQVMQIQFPLVSSPENNCGDSVIELFQCSAKKEFYIEIDWTGQMYILPLDHTLTFQYIIDYIIGCIPEIVSFTKQGYKFEYELEGAYNSEVYASTETILRAPMTEIPLSQGILHYVIPSKRTLDNHRWFLSRFSEIDEVPKKESDEKLLITYNRIFGENIILIAFAFAILSHVNNHSHILFTALLFFIIIMIIGIKSKLLHTNSENEFKNEDKKLYMCFSRPAAFGKNTHYIFLGTKTELRSAIEKIERDNNEIENDPDFVDTYQVDLLDTPLDTCCDDLCHCESEVDKTSNYDCSQWDLKSFTTQNELDDYIRIIAIQGYCNNGFRNEITCI